MDIKIQKMNLQLIKKRKWIWHWAGKLNKYSNHINSKYLPTKINKFWQKKYFLNRPLGTFEDGTSMLIVLEGRVAEYRRSEVEAVLVRAGHQGTYRHRLCTLHSLHTPPQSRLWALGDATILYLPCSPPLRAPHCMETFTSGYNMIWLPDQDRD